MSIIALVTPYYYLSILVAPAALAVFLFLNYTWLAFFLMLFFTPLDMIRTVSTQVTISELLGAFLLIALFFRVILTSFSLTSLFRSSLWVWITVFLIINIISIVTSVYIDTALKSTIKLLVSIFIFILVLYYVDNEKNFNRLVYFIISPISINVFFTIYGHITHTSAFLSGEQRGVGASGDANTLALWIVFSIPFLVQGIFYIQSLKYKFSLSILLLLHLFVIMLTLSRSGFLVALTVLIISLWYQRRYFHPRYLGLFIGSLGVFMLAIVMIMPKNFISRQETLTQNTHDSSLERRYAYLTIGWDGFKQSPFIGNGPGTFKEYYAQTQYSAYFAGADRMTEDQLKRPAHNTYLEVIFGSGLLGFIAFSGILWQSLKNFHLAKINFQKQLNSKMALWCDIYRLALLSMLIFIVMISEPYNKYLWLLIGLSEVLRRFSEKYSLEEVV
jgi:O-antigen ligase